MKKKPHVSYILLMPLLSLCGCMGALFSGSQASSTLVSDALDAIEETEVPLVGDYTRPHGMHYVKVESIALVTGLDGSGEDPAPTPQRATLIDEMRQRGIDKPSTILASRNTTLVLVQGLLRPGTQKGDRFDLKLRTPSRSETKSLRSGWMMKTRMGEMAVLGNRIRTGKEIAIAEGAILVNPSAEEGNDAFLTRGRILGGGVALESHPIGLIVDRGRQSIRTSQMIGVAINHRFHTYVNGTQNGVAKPKTDEFIQITVHPRYKNNVARFMQVIRHIAMNDSPSQQQVRLDRLDKLILDPLTTASAAIRLEAIGNDAAKEILKIGMENSDKEVQFYSAEALAYLDVSEAADILANIARDERAYRLNAFAALSAMDDPMSRAALRSLLSEKSAETRYGAFRSLWSMDTRDPIVDGIMLGDKFSFHHVPGGETNLIHATRSFRAEIVLFGDDHRFQPPFLVEAGRDIIVRGNKHGEVTVTRIAQGEPTQKRVISARVNEVIQTIIALGGTYPDVIETLQKANDTKSLSCRFRVDALPEPGRTYDRKKGNTSASSPKVATPLPELFGTTERN